MATEHPDSPTSPQSLWADMCSLVRHESRPFDNRIKWIFTLNGFLFAAMGLSLYAESGLLVRPCLDAVRCAAFAELGVFIRYAISIAGLLSALIFLLGLLNVEGAISGAVKSHQVACEHDFMQHSFFTPIGVSLPLIKGENASSGFPILICAVWGAFLLSLAGLTLQHAILAGVIVCLCSAAVSFFMARKADASSATSLDAHVKFLKQEASDHV